MTLVELTVSTVAATILIGGMASAVLLATHALPANSAGLNGLVDTANVIDQLAAELHGAVAVQLVTGREIRFEVPDRNSDGLPELVRYGWAGTAGDPLYRQYNGGTRVVVLDDVGAFELEIGLVGDEKSGTADPNESGETLLASYTDLSSTSDHKLNADKWIGQYFRPNLPNGTTSWTITRIELRLAFEPPPLGTTLVQVRRAAAGQLPELAVLAERPLAEATLTSDYEWREIAFDEDVGRLAVTDRVCLVLEHVDDTASCKVEFCGGGVGNPDLILLECVNGTWHAYPDKSLIFRVYGTVTSSGAAVVQPVQQLSLVRVRVQVGDEAQNRVETAIQLLNHPEIGG